MKKLLFFFLLISPSTQAQELYRMVDGVRIKLSPSDSADFVNEWKKNDSIQRANYGMDTMIANTSNRYFKIVKLRAYLRTQVQNLSTYESVEKAITEHIYAYMNGSDRIISWIKGENSLTYGNYTLTGFPSKPYYTVARQTELLNILQ